MKIKIKAKIGKHCSPERYECQRNKKTRRKKYSGYAHLIRDCKSSQYNFMVKK